MKMYKVVYTRITGIDTISVDAEKKEVSAEVAEYVRADDGESEVRWFSIWAPALVVPERG